MIYLVNHRVPGHEPFKNIMRLPRAQAFALAGELYYDTPGSSRFGAEFENYYSIRQRAEAWLHSDFMALGGQPQTKHPLYFYVHGWGGQDWAWPDKITEKIPLEAIDQADISFIYGDSCGEIDNPARHPMLTKPQLMQQIEVHGGIEGLLANVKHNMIEAHLRNDKYVREACK